jgi:hypothetical protein
MTCNTSPPPRERTLGEKTRQSYSCSSAGGGDDNPYSLNASLDQVHKRTRKRQTKIGLGFAVRLTSSSPLLDPFFIPATAGPAGTRKVVHKKVKTLFQAFSVTYRNHPEMSESRYVQIVLERVSRKPNLLVVIEN